MALCILLPSTASFSSRIRDLPWRLYNILIPEKNSTAIHSLASFGHQQKVPLSLWFTSDHRAYHWSLKQHDLTIKGIFSGQLPGPRCLLAFMHFVMWGKLLYLPRLSLLLEKHMICLASRFPMVICASRMVLTLCYMHVCCGSKTCTCSWFGSFEMGISSNLN